MIPFISRGSPAIKVVMHRNLRLPDRNNQDMAFSVRSLIKFAILLVLGCWFAFHIGRLCKLWYIHGGISKSKINNEQFPKDVVRNGSAGLSNSGPVKDIDFFLRQESQDEEDYQRIKKELEEFEEKSRRAEFEQYQEKYQRGERELIKKETLEENVSNALLHEKDDEKGVMTKMEASIQTKFDRSKLTDGVYSFSDENRIPQHVRHMHRFCDENGFLQHVHVKKIDEKGAPTKMKANIQTESDQSKLNEGLYSFSDENRMLQHFHVSKIEEKGALTKMKENIQIEHDKSKLNAEVYSYSDENGIPWHVLDKYLEMNSAEEEKETQIKEL